jgi:hypothetical protein
MKWLLGMVVGLSVMLAGIGIAIAANGPYGRDYGNGYFSNTTFAGSDLIFEPFGTNPLTDTVGFGPTCEHDCNLQSFQAVFQARLNDPTSVVDQGRAAALIDMMLGQQGPNFNGSSQSGIVYAQANFQKWENLLAVYANGTTPGYSVQWNEDVNFADPGFNGWTAVGATNANDWQDETDCSNGQQCVGDLVFGNNNGGAIVETTVDFNANGQQFIIRQGCGCTTGETQSLAIPSWTLSGMSSVSQVSASAGVSTPVTFEHTITNQGPGSANYPEYVDYYYPDGTTLQKRLDSNNQTTASGGTYTYTDSETIPASALPGQLFCEDIYFGNATGPLSVGATSQKACVTIQNSLQCGGVKPGTSIIQPDDSFTVSIDDTFDGGSAPPYTDYQVSIPAIDYADNSAAPTESGGELTYTTDSLRAPPQAGTYTINWQLYNGGNPEGPPCSGQLNIVDLPYFNVFGSDVNAGGTLGGCSSDGGSLAGWYDDQTGFGGSRSDLGAFALNNIVGFASGIGDSGAPPGGNGLTFSNSSNVTGSDYNENFGGNLGGDHCIFTPLAEANSLNDVPSTAVIGSAGLVNGAHNYNGNLTLNGGIIPATAAGNTGNNLSIFINGNVYISSNIVYGTNGGDWNINADGSSNIPSVYIVATGNIYISPTVTELDGVYVANVNASGGGGTIYTCGQGSFTPLPTASLYAGCNQQLTVYGSFIANQVNLMRTFGSLDDSTATETPNSASLRQCQNGGFASDCAAELFNFSPELYLSDPAIMPTNNGATSYDSEVDLPPVL